MLWIQYNLRLHNREKVHKKQRELHTKKPLDTCYLIDSRLHLTPNIALSIYIYRFIDRY